MSSRLDTSTAELIEPLRRLEAHLHAAGSLVVALSGGCDSSFLLAAAVRVLGTGQVTAATAVSASLAAAERAAAAEFARELGVDHVEVQTAELDRTQYRANGPRRCYFCKAELLETLTPLAQQLGRRHVATGTNADDGRDWRPGIEAAAQRGAITPLREAGLQKVQIRQLAREWGLTVWDKPAAPCLASRVAYGIEVTSARLARVERAEAALRAVLTQAGIVVENLRVRDLGDRASVAIDRNKVAELMARPELLQVVADFPAVEIDERGFRSGELNVRAGISPAVSG